MTEQDNSPRTVVLARKLFKGLVGGLIVLAGIVMLVTPGPGIVAILIGLGILATEFASARRIRDRVRSKLLRRPTDVEE